MDYENVLPLVQRPHVAPVKYKLFNLKFFLKMWNILPVVGFFLQLHQKQLLGLKGSKSTSFSLVQAKDTLQYWLN